MRQALAVSIPTQAEVENGAKTIAAVGGIVGGAWALASRLVKWGRARSQRRALETKAIRYLLDAQRHSLNVLAPSEERHLIDVEELVRQKLLIDAVRDELWIADGHESERLAQRQAETIANVMTRTQRIRVKTRKQDMFASDEGDQPE